MIWLVRCVCVGGMLCSPCKVIGEALVSGKLELEKRSIYKFRDQKAARQRIVLKTVQKTKEGGIPKPQKARLSEKGEATVNPDLEEVF